MNLPTELHTETVTVFNRKAQRRDTDIWVATIIPGCHVTRTRSAVMKKYGRETNNSIIVSMPVDGYKIPQQWKRAGFTLREDIDLIYLGEWAGDKEIVSDDFDTLMREEGNTFTVHTVSEFKLIPHLEVGCG